MSTTPNLPETDPAVNTRIVCPECEQTIPSVGPHIHDCAGFEYHGQRQPGGYDVYYDGTFVGSRRTLQAAQQLRNSHVYALSESGLITNPVDRLTPVVVVQTLADFDQPDGVTQRTVTTAELEQAATVLCGRTNGRALRQLADQVIVAHAADQLVFRRWSGMLEVASWLTNGELAEVILGECQVCESQTCLHAVLDALLAIRERGMTALVRRPVRGGYTYTQVAA